jgi:protease-4
MDVLERDFYEERRRKWRRSAFWRGFGVATVVGLIVALLTLGGDVGAGRDQIARYEIAGVILDDVERDKLMAALADSDHVRAVILRVNSPGGTTAGSEAAFASIRAVAAEKPVVAVMGEVAASGGYIAAIAADHVIGRGNTLTGSIGVIIEYPDFTELMARWGVGLETVRSSELKAEPSPFRPTNPAARAVEDRLVADSYAWFRGLVGERRGLEGAALDAVANGAVFTGRLALESRLIDAIGGEDQALEWLESREAGLADLPVRDWAVETETGLWGAIFGKITASGGILSEISRLGGPKLYSLAP